MKGKKSFFMSFIFSIIIITTIIPIAVELSGNITHVTENYNISYTEREIPINNMSTILYVDLIVSQSSNNNSIFTVSIALLSSEEYNNWIQTGKNTSLINKGSIIGDHVSKTTFSKYLEHQEAVYLVIWSNNGAPVKIFLNMFIIPASNLEILVLMSVLLVIFQLVMLVIILLNMILFFVDKRSERVYYSQKRENLNVVGDKQESRANQRQIIATEGKKNTNVSINSQISPQNSRMNNQPYKLKNIDYKEPLSEQIEEIVSQFTEKELLLFSISIIVFISTLFGSSFIPSTTGNYIRALGITIALILSGLGGTLYLLRKKKKQELISYVKLKKEVSTNDLMEILNIDLLSLQHLIIEINQEFPNLISVSENFDTIRYVQNDSSISSVSQTKEISSASSNAKIPSSEIVCPFCGAINDVNAQFCSQCGSSLVPPK